MTFDNSAVVLKAYRNLTGSVVPAGYLQAQRPTRVPRYQPQDIDIPTAHDENDTHILRALSAGLNRIERRTWWRILDGWSIDAIADADGVKRATIYCRIRGSGSNGSGGMVGKNSWVARWWEARTTLRSL